jgi:DNA primase catalytic core
LKQRIVNLESLCKQLKPFLPQYLEERGINTTKNFKCLNPKHEDNNFSMTVKQHPEAAFCFGCGTVCDLFKAASILENKPEKGRAWVEENVLYFAKKYGIQAELADLTQEEIYEYKTYEAYRLAAKLVSDRSFGDYSLIDKEIERRNWNKENVAKWGIGTVNYNEFRRQLKSAGFEARFLDGIDLSNPTLFENNNLIFTVYDAEGRPVGFSAKRLDREDGSGKYINTRQTGLECAIFRKGERLYGFEIAKEAPSPLYIFEGQANVITLRQHGLMNCCGIMGTAFTDHHLHLLKRYGCFKIVLMLDGDGPGRIATEKILDEKFAKEKDFRVQICQLPEDPKDPDEFVRQNGIDAFIRLKKWTAFEWRMKKFIDENEDEPDEEKCREIADTMIPIIVSESNYIRQEELSKQVAKMTGYDFGNIMAEVKRQRNEKEKEIHTLKTNAIESFVQEVRRNPEDAELSLAACQQAISDINKTTQGKEEIKSTFASIMSQKEVDDAKDGSFEGFLLNPATLGELGLRLNGNWRENALVYLGGSSQSGKSTLAAQILYEVANNPKNNAICIYHSIDDAKNRIVYKWVCHGTKELFLHQNDVSAPVYWERQKPGITKLRDEGYRKLLKLAQENKLVIKDTSDGSSFAYIENIAKYYRNQFPDKHILLCIDNFHKLPDLEALNETERVKKMSNHLKRSAVANQMTILATVEYRKLQPGEAPSNAAIASSRSLEYDADVIIHLYNELHLKGEERAEVIHIDQEGIIQPRIGVRFGKNKISGYTGAEFLNLYAGPARMVYVNKEVALKELEERKQLLRS